MQHSGVTSSSSDGVKQPLVTDAYLEYVVNRTKGDDEESLIADLSLNLASSYEILEQRVQDLTSELESVSDQRLNELTEKERLANRLDTLVQSLPGGVVVLDSSGLIVESNPAAEALLMPHLRQKYWREVVANCFMPRQDDGHEVSNKCGQRISIVTRSLGTDGQIILLTDLTETRRLQSEVSRNERLSALGKVVSTLAHQIRTPLSSAMLYANHLCDCALNDNQRQQFSVKLKRRLEYMERQVRDMLLFVKGDISLNDEVNVTELRQLLIDHIEPQIDLYAAEYTLQVDQSNHLIRCNLDALMGALLNLVTNSLQAADKPKLHIAIKAENKALLIVVTDNGPGIRPEVLSEAKNLFFTTKDQGTGIGLSVVSHVAESHGGKFILSRSQKPEPFTGLCAQLRLPIIAK